jgi:hypothetical protein
MSLQIIMRNSNAKYGTSSPIVAWRKNKSARSFSLISFGNFVFHAKKWCSMCQFNEIMPEMICCWRICLKIVFIIDNPGCAGLSTRWRWKKEENVKTLIRILFRPLALLRWINLHISAAFVSPSACVCLALVVRESLVSAVPGFFYPLIVLVPISELNFFGSKWMIQKSRLEGDTCKISVLGFC